MSDLPEIQCAVCHHPVERQIVIRDEMTGNVTIRVWCHGDTDSMVLEHAFLAKAKKVALNQMIRDGGIAFAVNRLPASYPTIEVKL